MDLYGKRLAGKDKDVETLYLGGGTPTCLPVDDLVSILQACREYFHLLPDAEITVEANPGTVDFKLLTKMREAGVNRLSLGVQTCQASLLELLGRVHTFGQVVQTIHAAREAGFANINLDLIFGIPTQTLAGWLDCLDLVLGLSPEHFSTYSLQIEEGTPLWEKVDTGELVSVSEETELAMYEEGIKKLAAAGYIHYEISNFARSGYQCRHNLRYWYNLPYLGLGPAAHSYLGNCRFSNEINLDKYINKLMSGEFPVAERIELSVHTSMAETVFLGLRLIQGVDLGAFKDRFGYQLEEVFSEQIQRLTRLGLVKLTDRRLRLTEKGLPVANRVFMEFV